jgi:hypothetical protein
MLEVSFFLFLILLFYGTGRVFLDVIRWKSNYLPFTLPSCIGVVVATIAVTWFYKLGGSLNRFFWFISISVGGFFLWKAVTRGRSLFQNIAGAHLEFLSMAGFAACIILPVLSGGKQFTLFRGNHHDSFNYLEAAITYRRLSYSHVSQLNIAQLVHLGLFRFGQDNLLYRPEITFLYATLSYFNSEAFLRLHYVLLIYFQFLSFCAVRALTLDLLPGRRIIQLLLATALVGGFWGQYILDIDAWSQISCMPLIGLSLLLLIKLAQTTSNPEKPFPGAQLIFLYALVWVGMLYLYPEAACFLIAGHVICWVIAIRCFRLRINWLTAGLTALVACGLLLPVFDSNVLFLIGQGRGSLAGFDWWNYFQAFFFGRDGLNPDLFSNMADFIAGGLGIYFITPDPTKNAVIAVAVRALILCGIAAFVFRFAKGARSMLTPPWLLLASFSGVSLLIALIFCALQQFWTAGKAFSFVAYLVLLILIAPAFRIGSSDRSWLNRTALTMAIAFLLLQLGFFLYRPIAANKPFAIHYLPPYPSLANRELKTTINFADWSFLKLLQPHDTVAVHIEDPFIQSFVRMLLLSHQVRFCLEAPAFDRSSHSLIVPTGNCPKATVYLIVTKSSKEPFAAQLGLIRPVPTP